MKTSDVKYSASKGETKIIVEAEDVITSVAKDEAERKGIEFVPAGAPSITAAPVIPTAPQIYQSPVVQTESKPAVFTRPAIAGGVTTTGVFIGSEISHFQDVLEQVKGLNKRGIVCCHAENHHLIARALKRAKEQNPDSHDIHHWAQTHPEMAEEYFEADQDSKGVDALIKITE